LSKICVNWIHFKSYNKLSGNQEQQVMLNEQVSVDYVYAVTNKDTKSLSLSLSLSLMPLNITMETVR